MAKCILKIGVAVYAELTWLDHGGVSIIESATAKADGFAKMFHRENLVCYDPRTGEIKEINPTHDKYSLVLWCAQWVNNRIRLGKAAEIIVEGISFDDILPAPEPGVVY
jgi:hypothetical protein